MSFRMEKRLSMQCLKQFETQKPYSCRIFIFGNDKISNELRELLIEKAKEGVRVRMIYDYWGSILLSHMYLQTLRNAGVYIRPFYLYDYDSEGAKSIIVIIENY